MHLDADSFFVSVEVARNPKLRGRPVVTGAERGIVTAISREAKSMGVIRAMPTYQVRKLYPSVIVLPGNYAAYAEASELMFNIVRRYADDVEEYSIDECFADLTPMIRPLKMSILEILHAIKKDIRDELSLPASVGLSSTKVLAKIATKAGKPDGLLVADSPESVERLLRATPIGAVWGIGRETCRRLSTRSIRTAYDLAVLSRLQASDFNLHVRNIWNELSERQVMPIDPSPKTIYGSIMKSRTFRPPTRDSDFLISELSYHADRACHKARVHGLKARSFGFFLKTQGFRYIRHESDLRVPTGEPHEIMRIVRKELQALIQPGETYRACGIMLTSLAPESVISNDLFGASEEGSRRAIVYKAVDRLHDKYGHDLIHSAASLHARKRTKHTSESAQTEKNLLFMS
jgi:DNA polymerase-4/DNA polymerase V